MTHPTSTHHKRQNDPLYMGIELEVPLSKAEEPTLTERGKFPRKSEAKRVAGSWSLTGELTYERIGGSEYGLEARCQKGGLPFMDVKGWYQDMYEFIEDEFDHAIEPTGLCGDTTAGLHIHLSSLSEDDAKVLAHWSEEPWLQAFCCSSLVADENIAPVFRCEVDRDNYCKLGSFNKSYNSVVKRQSSSNVPGHYEWRLPEPMTPAQFRLLHEFISRFVVDKQDAKWWAKEQVANGTRLASVNRASNFEALEDAAKTTTATNLIAESL